MSKALTEQELHIFAMNHVGKNLEDLGYKFVTINCKLQKEHPQFVCIDKNDQFYYIVVRVVKLPSNPYDYNVVRMESFKKHAYYRNAKVFYAGVGLGNAENEDLPVFINEDCILEYTGIQSVDMILN